MSVSHPRSVQERRVWELANETLAFLGIGVQVDRNTVYVDDSFVGGRYGQPTLAMWEALRTVARCEGMLLDPVCGGKAMAGLLAHVHGRLIAPDQVVVFLHAGAIRLRR